MKKLPASQTRPENFTLLTVGSTTEDRQSIESILTSNGWTIQGAKTLREATKLLQSKPSLILCEKDLPDCTWKDIFRVAQKLDYCAPFVVVSRIADRRLWAEVLNLGGFDMLLKPFEPKEVERVMNMAYRQALGGLQAYAAV